MALLKKKRLAWVLGGVCALAVCAGGLVAVRMKTIRQNVLQARERGLHELEAGDVTAGVGDLSLYLSRYPDDVVCLAAFAKARMQVEDVKGQYLLDTIGAYRKLATLKTDDVESQHKLMELYLRGSMNSECIQVAEDLLRMHPNDPNALQCRAIALMRMHKNDDALAAIKKYIGVNPDDIDGQIMRLQIMSQSADGRANLVSMADSVRKAHPQDVRGKLLMSVAYDIVGDTSARVKWAKDAATSKLPDAGIARVLSRQLWRVGDVATGDQVLWQGMKQFSEGTLQVVYARRLYELGKFDELLKMPLPTDGEAANGITVLGYQGAASLSMKDNARATEVIATLRKHKENILAQDWADVLSMAMPDDSVSDDRRVRVLKEIVHRRQNEGYFAMQLASSYMADGNVRDAFGSWQAAAAQEPAWAAPMSALAQSMVDMHRPTDALRMANAAIQRAPDDRDANVVRAIAWAGAADEDSNDNAKGLLQLLNKIQSQFPDEQRIIALRIAMIARVNGNDAAGKALTVALQQQPPVTLKTFLQLAAVSRGTKLGLEESCFDAAMKAYGSSPDLAYARAVWMATSGRYKDGLAMVESERNAAKGNRQGWDIIRARYMEMNHDSGSHGVWETLANSYPKDTKIQWLVLSAPSVQSDRDLTGKTIERLRDVIGETDFSFKLARARWLLGGQLTSAIVSEASNLLTDATKSSPDVLAPHLLLAECLERADNISGAIDQLQMATALAPDSASILLELSRLLQIQGNSDQVSANLLKLTKRNDLSPQEQFLMAGLLTRQGDQAQAIQVLEVLMKKGQAQDNARLLLATLCAQNQRSVEAEALLKDLLTRPTLPVVQVAANFYGQQGKMNEAHQALALLSTMHVDTAVVQMVQGDFESHFGKPDAVLALYQQAVKDSPKSMQAWYRLIAFYIQTGDGAKAASSIDQASVAVADDKVIGTLAERKDTIAEMASEPHCRPLLMALMTSSHDLDATDAALKAIKDAKVRKSTDNQLASELTHLADRYPTAAAVQNLAAEVNIAANHIDDAVAIATRAMQTFPTLADPARLAASAYASENRWSESLAASNAWKQRTPDQSLSPDVMAGYSYLGMGNPEDTLKQISPYLNKAAEDPETYAGVLILYARSELAKNHSAKAEAAIWPLVQTNRKWLGAYIDLARNFVPASDVTVWFEKARGSLGNDATAHLAFAQSAQNAAFRVNNIKLLTMAIDDLTEFTETPGNTSAKNMSMLFLARGMLEEARRTPANAIPLYRKALELDPDSIIAMNNLASVLADAGDLDESLKLANVVVEKAPKVAAFHDTLATTQAKIRDYPHAAEHLQTAVKLEPTNYKWRLGLAQVYADAGQLDKARSALMNDDGTQIRSSQVGRDQLDKLVTLQQRLGIRS